MAEHITNSTLDVNGIKMHIAQMGSGPKVILLHGFPETWYSWINQLKGLADEGYHAIAPDMRGFGLTECPKDLSGQFNLSPLDMVGDIVALIYALGGDPVFIASHDAGGFWGWILCLIRPDLVKGHVTVGAPLFPHSIKGPLDKGFYTLRFAVPGRAEKDFARFDTETVLKKICTLLARSELQIAKPDEEIMDIVKPSEPPPSWLHHDFLRVQTELFQKSGFEAPLCATYRNRSLELMTPWMNMPISTPCKFLIGRDDYMMKIPGIQEFLSGGQIKELLPNLTDVIYLPGGHFVQQDSPQQVNSSMINFFRGFN